MRKFALIAAMILVSATVQAGQSRSLTTVSADQPTVTTQPTAAEAPKIAQATTPAAPATPAETPTFVERPAVTTTTTPSQPNANDAKPVPQTGKIVNKADKPRHKRYWTEARIIGELHRHGIYW
jgi:uncharacterized protein YdeI (BOF family)